MHWLYILGLFVLVIGFFVVTGIRPKGGLPASGTHLMTAGRIILVIIVIVVAIAYFSSGSG